LKLLIAICAHDGICSMVTGVGVVVNSVIESFERILERSGLLGENSVTLVCITPYLQLQSSDWNENAFQIASRVTSHFGGSVVQVPTASLGASQRVNFGDERQWESLSASIANVIVDLGQGYDRVLVLANDISCSLIRKYIVNLDAITIVWIPHSLGFDFDDEFRGDRLSVEERILGHNVHPNDFVGSIGKRYTDILLKSYRCKQGQVVEFENGIYFDSFRYRETDLSIYKLVDISELIDKDVLFLFGRCSAQKGIDVVLEAFIDLYKSNPRLHLLLLIPTETSETDYLVLIRSQLAQIPANRRTVIGNFHATAPVTILRALRLHLVFASRYEGNPISAMEAIYFAHYESTILYTPLSQFKHLFKNDRRAVQLERLDKVCLIEAIETATKKLKGKSPAGSATQAISIVDNYSKGLRNVIQKMKERWQ
jgi:glycosyltransferase involved in cell wall biosynthesis